MDSTGVAELKANLSSTLARVKAGAEVLITEHGRPIARLVPIAPTADARTARLVRAGVLRPPAAPPDENFWQLPRGDDSAGAVRAALQAERDEAR